MRLTPFGHCLQITFFPGVFPVNCYLVKEKDGATLVDAALIDTVLTVLEPYELSYDEAVHIIRGCRTLGHGFASLEAVGAFGIDLETDESYRRLVNAFLQGLDLR